MPKPERCPYCSAKDSLVSIGPGVERVEEETRERFPDARIEVKDLAGDGNHYAATVVSSAFKGKNRVRQHQMVYEALKGRMGGELHALALTTSES